MTTAHTLSPTVSDGAPQIPTGRFKPLVSVLRHKWLALAVALLVFSIATAVVLSIAKVTYTARATLLVTPHFTSNLNDARDLNLRREPYLLFMKQQVKLMNRGDIIKTVLADPVIFKHWSLPNESELDAFKRLRANLTPSSKRGNPFLRVKLTSSKGKGLSEVLNKVVEVYLEKSKTEVFYDPEERVNTLLKRKEKLQAEIDAKRAAQMAIAAQLGVTTFTDSGLNPYDQILIESTDALKKAQRERMKAESLFNTLQQPNSQMLQAQLKQHLDEDSTLKWFKQHLAERKLQLETELLNLTPQHPSYPLIQQELGKIQQDYATAFQDTYQYYRQKLLALQRARMQETRSIEQAIADELTQQRQQANAYSSQYNQAVLLTQEIARLNRQLVNTDEKIDFLTTESKAPGYIRVHSLARSAVASSLGKKKVLAVLLLLSIALGIALAIGIDMLDPTIHTPGEVQKYLGFSPLAWFLELYDAAAEKLVIDQLRRLALALIRDRQNHNNYCFALTAVKSQGGTTTLCLNLARQLSALGMKTIAVELNAFKPDARYQTNPPAEGVAECLARGGSGVIPTVAATDLLPERVPVGQVTGEHLPHTEHLSTFLDRLSDRYDFVLIDSPPILLSADAELLGQIGCGVLLVVEAKSIVPGELQRAATLLERLNPPVVAALLNRVPIYHGGGYFAALLNEHESGEKRKSLLQRLLWR